MSNKHIAVIDDDIPINTMYSYKLGANGYVVKSAYDGNEGLTLLKEFKPALVLLDIRMPFISGDELLRKVRTYDWASNMRVIVLTNISKSEAPSSLRLLNVDRYIVKVHHTPQQLLDVVRELID